MSSELDRSFVLVDGGWPCGRAARLIRALGPTWIVVDFGPQAERRYRAFSRGQADLAFARDDHDTVASAFRLQIGNLPTVAVRRGRVVGLDLPIEPSGSRGVGTGPVAAGDTASGDRGGFGFGAIPDYDAGLESLPPPPPPPPPAPAPARAPVPAAGPVSRAVAVSAPPRVGLGKRASVIVSLTADVARPGTVPVAAAVGEAIAVVLEASGPLTIDDPAEGELTVTAAGTPMVRFTVLGRAVGAGEVTVHVFQRNQGIGSVTVSIEVVDQAVAAHEEVTTASIEPPRFAAPDLQLLVFESAGGFTIRLSATDPRLGLNYTPFGPFRLELDPRQFFDRFYADIEEILVSGDPPARKLARLASKGDYLFDRLLPQAAREHLWKLRSRITSVHVQSEEPWIPWELVKLSGRDDSGVVQAGGFLCEEFQVTRWVPSLPYQAELTLANLGVVTPGDAGLAAADAERQAIEALGTAQRHVTRIRAEEIELRQALAGGTYDGLHFTGHGLAGGVSADCAEIRLEDGSRLRPEDLTGVVANLARARPIVFLNACQIGRAGMGLTGPGGWPRGFLSAGAGAFIGPYWNVLDRSASAFAQQFYDELIAGKTIGEAALAARLGIKAASDPTWLAYSVYGHSAARLG